MSPDSQKLNREVFGGLENLNLINEARQTTSFTSQPENRSSYDNEAFLSDNDEEFSDRPRQFGRRSNPFPRVVSVNTEIADDGNTVGMSLGLLEKNFADFFKSCFSSLRLIFKMEMKKATKIQYKTI